MQLIAAFKTVARNIITKPPKEADLITRDVFNVFVTYYKCNIKQSNITLLVFLNIFCHDCALLIEEGLKI
jgi:hypothetical protein